MATDLGSIIQRLLKMPPLLNLREEDKMIVAGQLGYAMQEAIRKTEERLNCALGLLERAVGMMENEAPDKTWFQDYFAFTGEHMILTEDGWLSGESKDVYAADEILAEVNAPTSETTTQAAPQSGASAHLK